jgi:hypothetical protein
LDTILINDETDSATDSALTSPESRSLRDSGYSEDGISTVDLSHTLDADKTRQTSFPTSIPETNYEDERDLNQALANEAFKSMMAEQMQQFQRVSLFESNQRKALFAYHQWLLKRLCSRLESSKAEKVKQVSCCTPISHISLLMLNSTLSSLNV